LYEHGGWVVSGSYSVACIGAALIVVLLRGPWEEGWIGWHGGYSIYKKDRLSADGKPREVDNQPQPFVVEDEEKASRGPDAGSAASAASATKI
jgi:hypothetical protein